MPSEDAPAEWDFTAATAQALVTRCREATELLACHIADQVGRAPGAELCVVTRYTVLEPDDEFEEGFHIFFDPKPRWATLIKQSGRTLTVDFDPDDGLPGSWEIDITDVRY